MPVRISLPHLPDTEMRRRVRHAITEVLGGPAIRGLWTVTLFRSRDGSGWDLAVTGPGVRKVFTLYGPTDDLAGLVAAHLAAIVGSQ